MKKNNNRLSKETFFLFTCVKNGRKYIQKLFDSLLKQTKINFVHYIYEDGSEDPVDDLITDYKTKANDIGLQVIYEKQSINIGLNMATKHCIEQCFLPYFIWIDCDNWVDSRFFEELGNTVRKKNKPNIVRTNKSCVHLSGAKATNFLKKSIDSGYSGLLILLNKYYYSFFAVKKDFYNNINPATYFENDVHLFNDSQVLMLCYQHTNNVCFCKKAYGYVLLRNSSEFALNKSESEEWITKLYSLCEKLNSPIKYHIEDIKRLYCILNEIDLFRDNRQFSKIPPLFEEKHSILRRNRIPVRMCFFNGNEYFLSLIYKIGLIK